MSHEHNPELQSKTAIQKGNFTQVPNELIEFFMNRKHIELTSREYAIIFFLIRELQGWDYKFKPIEIAEFCNGTGLHRAHLMCSLKELVLGRNILLKKKVKGFRTPCYGFNEDRIGRALVTQEPKSYFKQNSKVVDLVTFKVANSATFREANMATLKNRKLATISALQKAKDPDIQLNTNLKRENKVDTFGGNGEEADNRDPRLLAAIERFKRMPGSA